MFDKALVLLATIAVWLVAASAAMAGNVEVVAGQRALIDVGDRDNYTTLTIRNLGTSPGRLEFADGRVIDIPTGGSAEIHERLGRGGRGSNYLTVLNTGATTLRVASRYQYREQMP